MSKSTIVFIFFLAIIAALMGYNYFATPFYQRQQTAEQQEAAESEVDLDQQQTPQERQLNQMSSRQKIAQIIVYPYSVGAFNEYESQREVSQQSENITTEEGDTAAEIFADAQTDELVNPLKQLQDFQPGVISFYGSNIDYELAKKELQKIEQFFIDKQVRPLLAINHEGGSRQPFSGEGFTALPPWQQLCQETQMVRQEQLLEAAHELLELDINIVFAPVADLDSQVLGDRSCADERSLLSAARNFIEIFGSRQIMPTLKHYPGLGTLSNDLHNSPGEVEPSAEESEIFSTLFDLYPTIGVMMSHAQNSANYGQLPCSLNTECVNSITGEYNKATVFTDALNTSALEAFSDKHLINDSQISRDEEATSSAEADFKEAALKSIPNELTGLARVSYLAIMAGNHLLVYNDKVDFEQLNDVKQQLAELYDRDEAFAEQVDQSVLRVISLKNIN